MRDARAQEAAWLTSRSPSTTHPTLRDRSRSELRRSGWDPPGVRRWKAGTDQRTVVADHGGGNTGRLPLRSAVEGMPREARERRSCHAPCSTTDLPLHRPVLHPLPHSWLARWPPTARVQRALSEVRDARAQEVAWLASRSLFLTLPSPIRYSFLFRCCPRTPQNPLPRERIRSA